MDALIKRLQEERLNLWEQQKAALDAASAAGRTHLDDDDEQAYNTRNARIDEIDARVRELVEQQKRSKEAEDAFAALAATARVAPPPAASGEADRLRSFFRGESGRALEVTRPEGERAPWRRSAAEARDLLVGTATAGGNTVPTSFYGRLVDHLIEVSGLMMAGPTVLSTDSGEALQVPRTTSHSTAAIVAEAAAIGESDPAFGQVTLNAFKYGLLLQLSYELVQDTGVDLLGYVAMQAGRALGNAFGAHAITGNNTGQPNGVATAATVGVTGATSVGGAFTAENLIDLHYSVIAPYRASRSCSWLMRDATLATARKLRDASGGAGTGQFLWQPSLVAGAPDTILGKPVHTDPFVAAVGLSNRSVLFGDFSQYFVRMVSGMRFERSDDFAFANDLVTYRALLRADGDLIDTTGAVRAFVGGAT